MTRRHNPREDQMRLAVAQEAARLMDEHGIEDFLLAKRKAAERLMISDAAALPKNAEIEAALVARQRLFSGVRHPEQLDEMRRVAIQAMRLLNEFSPRLVGSILTGSATANAEINLHVFAAYPEQVVARLEENGIAAQHAEKKFRYEAERYQSFPSFKFVAGQQRLEIVVFPMDGIRQAPSSPVDGKPMARADLAEVQQLLKRKPR
jgi:hypothetical protein